MNQPNPDQTTDLILRAKEGDQEAYDALFANAAERLQLFIRVRLGQGLREKEQSLDLLQETYLAAHKAFDSFEDRGDGGFVRWLCRIAENRIRSRAEFHRAARRIPQAAHERVSQVLDKLRTRTLGPATRAERVDERERLAAALAVFPDDEREILLMRFFEDVSIDDIADRQGLSPSSIRRVIGRATLRLAKELESKR
ncbi:MAG: sigma-70 family RNA polymerase sigma factor [bacterium]|nr:sigma-70 family RNA polymerase sigma factor [bacterium]